MEHTENDEIIESQAADETVENNENDENNNIIPDEDGRQAREEEETQIQNEVNEHGGDAEDQNSGNAPGQEESGLESQPGETNSIGNEVQAETEAASLDGGGKGEGEVEGDNLIPSQDEGGDKQEVPGEDAADAKSQGDSNNEGSLVPTPTPATRIRLDTRKHTTTPADDSGLVQPVLPGINKAQANVQQMTKAITHARRRQEDLVPTSRHPVRNRVPPKLVRLATVTVSPAKSRPNKSTSLYYEEPRKPAKVITWDEANNHRPPLRIDMEGPGPCSYSPVNKPLGETNAPSYTFGTKCYPEKDGGSRTSWGKSWFQSQHLWHNKADYAREGLWPSPNHYPKPALLGPRQRTTTEAPSYTFGHRQAFSIVKAGAAKEPSPNEYERHLADSLVLRRGPSFTHQFRREGTVLWGSLERTPAPGTYAPERAPKHQRPVYTIQGVRREKSHILGPYSTL